MKTLEDPVKAPAHAPAVQKQAVQFRDNRAVSQLQRNMQDSADNSTQSRKNIQMQSIAQKSVSATSAVAQFVKYPAYQTFKGSDGITYCSRTKFKSHAAAAPWVGSVLAQLQGVSCNGKPRAVAQQPRNATYM
jgi:hypothetical protein